MRLGRPDFLHFAVRLRMAEAEFRLQVFPLIKQLPAGFIQLDSGWRRPDFCLVESIPPAFGFIGDACQIGSDERERFGLVLKPHQLRMPGISSRLTGDDFLGQKSFAPKRDQSLNIKISRMNRPKSHRVRTLSSLAQYATAGFSLSPTSSPSFPSSSSCSCSKSF